MKYRVVQIHEEFHPEVRRYLRWRRLTKGGFRSLEDAISIIKYYEKNNRRKFIIHKVDIHGGGEQ
jgi:hypothetical protein